uniref:Ovule protein n=1 Tax=Romanomermis culicivorax TaxID=13658 RepID=A0A915I835_ROMCU
MQNAYNFQNQRSQFDRGTSPNFRIRENIPILDFSQNRNSQRSQSRERLVKYCTYHDQCKHDSSECYQLKPQAFQPRQQQPNQQWQNNHNW